MMRAEYGVTYSTQTCGTHRFGQGGEAAVVNTVDDG